MGGRNHAKSEHHPMTGRSNGCDDRNRQTLVSASEFASLLFWVLHHPSLARCVLLRNPIESSESSDEANRALARRIRNHIHGRQLRERSGFQRPHPEAETKATIQG